MTHEEITLPLEEAVLLAVEENIDRDKRMDVIDRDECDYELIEMYEKEAHHILTTAGEGFIPDYPDHHHIRVGQ